jgi:simple sugar transport system ATP-binding protein
MASQSIPIIQLTNIGKSYGNFVALKGVSVTVRQGEVTCILGDNGAGKSTLISIIAGLHGHDEGTYAVDGEPVRFTSPREALDRGIATVYQTLAMVPLLSVWRNFFLGSELKTGKGPFRRLDVETMMANTDTELRRMGIQLADLDQPVGTLSGGQRQVVAIARAIHFGARVLQRGEVELDMPRAQLSLDDLMFHMAGGAGLSALEHELHRAPTAEPVEASVNQ